MPVLHAVLHESGLFSNGNPLTLPSYRLFIPWPAKTPIQISELLLSDFRLAALAFLLSLAPPNTKPVPAPGSLHLLFLYPQTFTSFFLYYMGAPLHFSYSFYFFQVSAQLS